MCNTNQTLFRLINRIALPVIAVLLACCSGTHAAKTESSSGDRATAPVVVVVVSDSVNKSHSLVVEQIDVSRLLGASQLTLQVYRASTISSEVPLTVASMGAPGRAETVTTMITARPDWSALADTDSMVIRATVNGEQTYFRVVRSRPSPKITSQQVSPLADARNASSDDTSALKMLVSYRRNADSSYTFTVRALRRRQIDGEYFPSSESLRLRLINGKGQVVWSSNNGMAFLTMITAVEPPEVGGFHDYTVDWNGLDNSGEALPPGTYRMEVVLPAKPMPYATIIELLLPLP